MTALDRDALVCDFAEYYHVLDMDALPLELRATLAAGLREESRIRTKLSGREYEFRDELLMLMFDSVRALVWLNSRDGAENRNRPVSIFDILNPKESESEYEPMTPEELMKALYG